MDVLLTDAEYLQFVRELVSLLVKYGFVEESDRDAEIEFVLERCWQNKPYETIS